MLCRTRLRRARAVSGLVRGSYPVGFEIRPLSIAASHGRSSKAAVGRVAASWMVPTEVGLRGGLDSVRALAEVDLVQVLGEDLVLVPLALELVGERGLAKLLEHR